MDLSIWQLIVIVTLIALIIYFRKHVYRGIQVASDVAQKGFHVSKQGFELSKKGYRWSAGKVQQGKQFLYNKKEAYNRGVIKAYYDNEKMLTNKAQKEAEMRLHKYYDKELLISREDMLKWATSTTKHKHQITAMKNTLAKMAQPKTTLQDKQISVALLRGQALQMEDDAGIAKRAKEAAKAAASGATETLTSIFRKK